MLFEVVTSKRLVKGFKSWAEADEWAFNETIGTYGIQEDVFCEGCRSIQECQCPSHLANNCNFSN